jgi:putative transposase
MKHNKAKVAKKGMFNVSAHYRSQECADCGHTHPSNRKSQREFICGSCGNADNADRNATMVLKKRAIKLILDSGTELSKRNVLVSKDKGRGVSTKSLSAKVVNARNCEPSKKKRKVVKGRSCGLVLEARGFSHE